VPETSAPASYVQRAMWAAAQRNRGAPLNVMILPWRIQGHLQIHALEAAVTDVIKRHPTLRTRLGLNAGQLLQLIGEPEHLTLIPLAVNGATSESRLETGTAMLRDEGRQPLDLIAKSPIRLRLLRLDATDHVLCIFVHHAMCDGWSSQIIMRDLAAFYRARTEGRAAELPELIEQYADFAGWQIRTYESGGFVDEIRYWREELADLPPPVELPTIVPRKGNRDCRAESPANIESPEVLSALKTLARRRRSSLFSVLLAGIAVLLYDRTGADDLVVGVSTGNRRTKEDMQFVGCATNLLPARIRLTATLGFDELVSQVHATIRRLLAYGRIPLELLLRELQGPLPMGPVFPIWCQYREPSSAVLVKPEGPSLTPLLVDRAAIVCDLEADLIESDRGLECVFAHRAALFEARMVAALLADYGAMLRLVSLEPNLRVDDVRRRACTVS
jgi:hypothetical protein